MIVVAALASLAIQLAPSVGAQDAQALPPWLGVHTLPAGGRQVGDYRCDAGTVHVEILDPGFQAAPRVEVWRIADHAASPQDLARWNDWLQELAIYGHYEVACRGDWTAISLTGAKRGDGSDYSVMLFWRDGQMWRVPQSVEEWQRAEAEEWFPPQRP